MKIMVEDYLSANLSATAYQNSRMSFLSSFAALLFAFRIVLNIQKHKTEEDIALSHQCVLSLKEFICQGLWGCQSESSPYWNTSVS